MKSELSKMVGLKVFRYYVSPFHYIHMVFYYIVPSAPVNVSLSVINNDTLLVTWDPPLRPNGIILYYEVHKAYSTDSQSTEIYYNVTMSTHLFITGNSSSLSNCTIRVRAATSVGLGSFAGVVSNVSRSKLWYILQCNLQCDCSSTH